MNASVRGGPDRARLRYGRVTGPMIPKTLVVGQEIPQVTALAMDLMVAVYIRVVVHSVLSHGFSLRAEG